MLPYHAKAEQIAKVLLEAREPGVDTARIGRVLFAVLNAPTIIQSAFVRALSDESVWRSETRWYLRETLRGNRTYAHQMEQYLGGFVDVRRWLERAEAFAAADKSPSVCEQHLARALQEISGPRLDSILGMLGINGQLFVQRVEEQEGEITTEQESKSENVDPEALLSELTRLLEARSAVEARGPTTVEAQEWLANVSAILSQVDAADAEAFNRGAHTIQRSLSSYTAGPIWNEMLLIIRRTIARLRLQAGSGAIARDALTGLGSRGAFDTDLPRLLAEAHDAAVPLALIVSDVDDFKRVNDDLGHQVGDRVLQAVASELGKVVQGRGQAYRYGGEEMVIILLNATQPEAVAVAERARASVERLKMDGVGRPITVSIGIAVFPDQAGNAADLLKKADEAMYRAKQSGKNRVEAIRTT